MDNMDGMDGFDPFEGMDDKQVGMMVVMLYRKVAQEYQTRGANLDAQVGSVLPDISLEHISETPSMMDVFAKMKGYSASAIELGKALEVAANEIEATINRNF